MPSVVASVDFVARTSQAARNRLTGGVVSASWQREWYVAQDSRTKKRGRISHRSG